MLGEFRLRALRKLPPRHVPGRIKQWLNLLRRNFVQAGQLYAAIRGLRTLHDIDRVFMASGIALAGSPDLKPAATADDPVALPRAA
jgi:tRNA-dihydrouridine synthase C